MNGWRPEASPPMVRSSTPDGSTSGCGWTRWGSGASATTAHGSIPFTCTSGRRTWWRSTALSLSHPRPRGPGNDGRRPGHLTTPRSQPEARGPHHLVQSPAGFADQKRADAPRSEGSAPPSDAGAGRTRARESLDESYARGQLTDEEYQDRLQHILADTDQRARLPDIKGRVQATTSDLSRRLPLDRTSGCGLAQRGTRDHRRQILDRHSRGRAPVRSSSAVRACGGPGGRPVPTSDVTNAPRGPRQEEQPPSPSTGGEEASDQRLRDDRHCVSRTTAATVEVRSAREEQGFPDGPLLVRGARAVGGRRTPRTRSTLRRADARTGSRSPRR